VLVRLLRKEDVAFDPEALKAMSAAYDGVRELLHITDADDPLAEIIAKNIIDVARAGQLDPNRLRDLVLAMIRL
jgi:hypothetical protein